MKKELGLVVIALAILVGVSATWSLAQQKQSPPPDRERIERERTIERQAAPDGDVRFEIESEMQGPDGPLPPGMPGDFVFLATEMSFGGKLVKGAPYSGQAVTESVQTLSDGNRIVNKSTAAIYRDSEGRTRREQTLRAIAAFANGGEPPQTIFISDAVAGTSYLLDPRTHTAQKMPPMNFKFQFKVPPPSADQSGPLPDAAPAEPIEQRRVEMRHTEMGAKMAPDHFISGWGNHVANKESLGKQNVEGVEAEGTRSTVTIPAGEIGNERPIDIINESWYSPELQTLVMTRHSDPRFGESSYRLTNIDRSEPARSLFEVPADYILKAAPFMPGNGVGVSFGGGVEGGSGTATYRATGVISGGVLNSRATSLPIPPYPPMARAAHASGKVTVEVTLDEDGNVVAARAVSGHPLLQAASVAAARNAKFSPTKLSGQPVKVQGVLIYTFSGEPAPPVKEKN